MKDWRFIDTWNSHDRRQEQHDPVCIHQVCDPLEPDLRITGVGMRQQVQSRTAIKTTENLSIRVAANAPLNLSNKVIFVSLNYTPLMEKNREKARESYDSYYNTTPKTSWDTRDWRINWLYILDSRQWITLVRPNFLYLTITVLFFRPKRYRRTQRQRKNTPYTLSNYVDF